ncbi:hypothetical protein O6217_23975, partial [Salmonella enterica subsp. enterica]
LIIPRLVPRCFDKALTLVDVARFRATQGQGNAALYAAAAAAGFAVDDAETAWHLGLSRSIGDAADEDAAAAALVELAASAQSAAVNDDAAESA